jgi:hypothetical protein
MTEDADRLRKLAAFCRELAERDGQRRTREGLLHAAKDYEKKAKKLERRQIGKRRLRWFG